MILLHGGFGSISHFKNIIEPLSKKYRVIAMDSPGQGRSEQIDSMSYQIYANYYAEFIDNLKLDSVYVLGWSDGGNSAFILAYDRPDKVKKVIVSGANSDTDGYQDGDLEMMKSHSDPKNITKKVADKLEEIFKKDRTDFEAKWEDIKIFVQYGMLSEDKFYEKAQKFALLKSNNGTYSTLEEYAAKVAPIQTDKDKRVIYLYTTNVDEQHSFIATAEDRGYDVLVFDSPIDSHYINQLESKLKDTSFVRVDADTIDKLIKKEEAQPSKLSDEEQKQLQPIVEGVVPKEKFIVMFESLSEKDAPMLITKPEFMRRMKDMSAMGGGGMNFYGSMPDMHNLVINSNHPLITKILNEKDAEKQKQLTKQAADLAMLSQGLLKGEELTKFIKRSVELI